MTACSTCGRSPDPETEGDPPMAWTADVVRTAEGPQTRWVCPACTRRFLRAMEAKLDQDWW